jgi:hypothetical protein
MVCGRGDKWRGGSRPAAFTARLMVAEAGGYVPAFHMGFSRGGCNWRPWSEGNGMSSRALRIAVDLFALHHGQNNVHAVQHVVSSMLARVHVTVQHGGL